MKKRMTFCAALLLAVAVLFNSTVTASATSLADSIRQMQEQIQNAEREKKNLQGSISDLQKIKQELEKEKGNLKNYVTALDKNVQELENNIQNLEAQIADKENEITRTRALLEEAQATEARQYESMRTRIRFMYESDIFSSLWTLLVTSDGIGDFLNKADYINGIYAYDRKMWEEYQMNCEYISLCEENLELEKELLDGQKHDVEEEHARVEALIEEKTKEIIGYESDINNKEQAIREYEQDVAEQNEIIAQLEAAVKEARKKLQAQSAPKYDGGQFKFPLETYTRVSDDYGDRIHPTLHVPQFHNGVDFASPRGTAIYAAYNGQVIAADYSASMGNYVMIDHGDGLYTIYMHASKLCVSKNDVVVAGDKIAEVGSTGRSTGNHLHFSVRLNGAYVSPWNYLSL